MTDISYSMHIEAQHFKMKKKRMNSERMITEIMDGKEDNKDDNKDDNKEDCNEDYEITEPIKKTSSSNALENLTTKLSSFFWTKPKTPVMDDVLLCDTDINPSCVRDNENKKITIDTRKIEKWVEDDSVTRCYKCDQEFSILLRRHHCRSCGRVFCYMCSKNTIKLPLDILSKIPDRPLSLLSMVWKESDNDSVRVCNDCYTQINNLLKIKNIIKVFEICQFDIKELYLLSKINSNWHDAAKFCLSRFREIQYRLSIEELTEYEKRILWINREYLAGHSRWIVQLVKSTDMSDEKQVLVLEKIIYKKRINKCFNMMCSRFCSEKVGINDMLDLVRYNKNYPIVSNFILKCLMEINIDTLINYIPFLIHNTKNNEYMLDILLDKGIDNFKFMGHLYWCVKVFCNDHHIQTEHIKKILMTIKKNTSFEFRERFKEMVFMKKIYIQDIQYINEKTRIVLPICLDTDFISVDHDNIKIMSSSSQPAIIPFITKEGKKKSIMFKNDDVRKDYIILGIMNIIHDILKNDEECKDIEIVKYEVMPTSDNTGYIEIVDDAATIFNIIEKMGLTIQNYILNYNKTTTIGTFRERFIKSTALYCVVSYLLGIGDRHLDNIMISKSGLLFHIDFGFILGQDPKYSNNKSIRVTPEIVNVIGGYGTEDYDKFKKLCIKIYEKLRLHVNLFANLLSIVPSIDKKINIDMIRHELGERFEIGENCIEAATHMDNKVESKNNFEYMIIDFLYKSKQNLVFKGISYVCDLIKK